jgi:hypothetical protein
LHRVKEMRQALSNIGGLNGETPLGSFRQNGCKAGEGG